MEHGGERRNGGHEAALRAVQRAPAKPMRSAGALPPKVYRVEPRDFRELVQRLTGARAAPASTAGPTVAAPAYAAATQAVHGRREAAAAAEQFDYSSWFSAPLLSPASMSAGMDGHHHGALL